MGKLSSPKVASVLNIHYLKIKMPLLDFKLLLWIKQMLKSISEKRFAQCLTSASLWELWLSLLTHSVEKWAIELFEFEGKMSQILPVWFFHPQWRFRQSLLPLRRSSVSQRKLPHPMEIPHCAAYGPNIPVYLEKLSSQQSSPSPAFYQFCSSLETASSVLQWLDQHQIQPMSSRVPLTHSCVIQQISSLPVRLSKSLLICKSQSC